MSKIFSLLLAIALITPRISRAQDQNTVPAPKPPFLAPVPDNTVWTIKVSSPGSTAKSPAGSKTVDELIIVKSGATREMISKWSDGSQSEIWFSHGYRIENGLGHAPILITPMGGGSDAENADYFNLDWLDLSSYQGPESQNGEPCYYFKREIKYPERHLVVDYAAYIKVKTRLPVTWDVGPSHFESVSIAPRPSTDPLVLPDALARQLNAYRLAAGLVNAYKKP